MLTDEECEHLLNLSAIIGTKEMVRAIYKIAQDHLRAEIVDMVMPEHIASESCWCLPEKSFVDPETGNTVFVHREIQ